MSEKKLLSFNNLRCVTKSIDSNLVHLVPFLFSFFFFLRYVISVFFYLDYESKEKNHSKVMST